MAARAMDGPNGTGVFLPCPLTRRMMMPTIIPMTAAKNNVNSVPSVPSTPPIKKNNLISPPPIPPLDSIAIRYKILKPTTAPSTLSHHGVRGDRTRPITSNGKKNSKILSGMSIYAKSDTTIMTSKELNNRATINSKLNPSCQYEKANSTPVTSSING